MKIISYAGNTLFITIIQIIIGYLLSAVIVKYIKPTRMDSKLKHLALPAFVVAGVLLPLNTYGLIPIVATLFTIKVRPSNLVSIIVSNALFNMSYPFTETRFMWSNSYGRVLLAVALGIISGLLLNKLKFKKEIIRGKLFDSLAVKGASFSAIFKSITNGIYICALYIIVGSIAEYFLYSFLLESFKTLIYGSKAGLGIVGGLARLNLFNGVFLTGLNIVDMLISPFKFSALLVLFRFRGIIGYYIFCSLAFIALSISLIL